MNEQFSSEELMRDRSIAGLGYIVFFVPLIALKDSRLGRYCANQGLILAVAMLLVGILTGILGAIPLLGWLIKLVGRLVCFALFLVGLACYVQLMTNAKAVELPYVGAIRLLEIDKA